MNSTTDRQFYPTSPLSLQLHAQARRERALVMGALFRRLLARLSAPRAVRMPAGLRWG